MINVKNKLWILLIIFAIIVAVGIFFYTNKNRNENSKYQSDKISTNTNNNSYENVNTYNNINNTTNNSNSTNSLNITTQTEVKQPNEDIITSFSTKIYNKESERQTNVEITCSTLNGTIVRNGSTFSFCDTVGQATTDKGYQEADIFDRDGNKKKGLGGGNCQVSTTLYNAALQVPNIEIIERHEHSNKVPYISEGKDAAVAYGSYDLKFKNNTGNDIMIKADATTNNVTITLVKL